MSTMLPSSGCPRAGTKYRAYKAATAELASWLGQTASTLGVVHKDGFKIAQFGTFTDLIIGASPRVDVPLEIVKLAKKALLMRKERADMLSGIDYDSDERHQHVIAVLGEVFEKLNAHHRICRQAALKSEGTVITAEEDEGILAPSFQILDLDPLESDEDGGCPEQVPRAKLNKNQKNRQLKKKKKAKEQIKHIYLRDDDEDPYFVLVCLLSDLKSMRDYIKELWLEYKDVQVDLVTASLTTNAAFDIIRTYQDDFPGVTNLLENYYKTMKLILSRHWNESDESHTLFFRPCTNLSNVKLDDMATVGQSLSKIPEIADLTFASAFYFLNGPRHVIAKRKNGKMQTANGTSDLFGEYKVEQDRETLSPAQRFFEDIQILAAYARVVYRCEMFPMLTLDHFTMQWTEELAKTGSRVISLAQAFGAQVYLDIHHVLRRNIFIGLVNLTHASRRVLASIRKWDEHISQFISAYGDGVKEEGAFTYVTQNLRANQLLLQTGILDEMQHAANVMKRGGADALAEKVPLYPFMFGNPLLCGVILFQLLAWHRDAGSCVGQLLQTIQHAGQLYYTCTLQRSSCETNESGLDLWGEKIFWTDMDHLFELYGLESIFNGCLPKSNVEIRSNLEGAFDVPSYQRCACSRPKEHYGPVRTIPILSKKGAEPLRFAKHLCSYEAIAVTHRLFFSKYQVFHCKEHMKEDQINDWTLETLQALLEERLEMRKTRGDYVEHKSKGGKQSKAAGPSVLSKEGEVSQVTILRTLKEALHSESRALRFDMLSFHVTCFQLISSLKTRCQHLLESTYKAPVEAGDEGEDLRLFGRDLQMAVNAPGPNSTLRQLNPSGDGTFFFNDGHLLIDATIRGFFEGDRLVDEEVKKLDRAWEIDLSQT